MSDLDTGARGADRLRDAQAARHDSTLTTPMAAPPNLADHAAPQSLPA